MKVKFLRDYHGPETNEFRHLQGAEVVFPDAVALNFIERKIVEPMEIELKQCEPVAGFETFEPVVEESHEGWIGTPIDEESVVVPEVEAILPEIKIVKPKRKKK